MKHELNFKELYDLAISKLNYQKVTECITTGVVACALITKAGNVYTGINIEVYCGLGNCAERSAFVEMLQNGETEVKKLVCVAKDINDEVPKILTPCGVCREYMLQMNVSNKDTQILTDLEGFKTFNLTEFYSNWWHKK
jgi:cytidine deaminase